MVVVVFHSKAMDYGISLRPSALLGGFICQEFSLLLLFKPEVGLGFTSQVVLIRA